MIYLEVQSFICALPCRRFSIFCVIRYLQFGNWKTTKTYTELLLSRNRRIIKTLEHVQVV